LESHLKAIIHHCEEKLDREGASYTPSDFKNVKISRLILDELYLSSRSSGNEIAHIYPASSLQQGFIYHALSQDDDDAYRVQVLYDYHKKIEVHVYLEAWQKCIEQYPVLRTGFNWKEEIIQIVYKRGHLEYSLHDISGLPDQHSKDVAIEAIQVADRKRGFDLTKPTLLRLHIIKQSEDYYTVLKTEHHSVSDGWSGSVLLGSVERYYNALRSNKEINIEEDRSYLLAQEYISKNKGGLLPYWNKVLEKVEGATDISGLLSEGIDLDSYKQVREGATSVLTIGGSTYKSLKAFSQREGITINVMVQFIWHKLLQVYSGSTQSIVGTTVSGRDLPVEGIEESVGLYINTLPLIVDWNNDATILTQLHRIQEGVTMLNTHSFADLAKLQRDGRRLFHSLFVFENYPIPKGEGMDGRISMRNFVEKADYPLTILSYEHDDTLTVTLRYDGYYLNEEKARAHMGMLDLLLKEVLAHP
ncbi:condensation domain-containing protein, partial [Algoriphagus sp. 4150]|uniref:condensation domain-containing protein n=1 Tax=Algoriphagus sp. 4150 TaxID=2817756 RepID=UPI00286A7A8A